MRLRRTKASLVRHSGSLHLLRCVQDDNLFGVCSFLGRFAIDRGGLSSWLRDPRL